MKKSQIKNQKKNLTAKKAIRDIKIVLVVIVALTAFKFLIDSFGRYESDATGEAEASVAFFIIDEKVYGDTILLGEIIPSDTPYIYTFLVSNFKGNQKADVDLKYNIELLTTTNLPLTYELYKNQEIDEQSAVNIISNSEIYADEYGTYFNKIQINQEHLFTHKEKLTDTYKLVVIFDENYKNSPDQYEGVIESVRIKIDAKQDI